MGGRLGFWYLLLVLLPLGLAAQARTVAVVDFLPLTPGANPALSAILADSIGLQLAQGGYNVVDKAAVRAAVAAWSDPRRSTLTRADVVALAKSLGADAVVSGFYGVEGRLLTVGVRAYDVLSGRLAVSAVEDGESGLAVFDTIDAMAATVVGKVRESLPDLAPTEIVVNKETVKVETVTVTELVEKGTLGTLTLTSPMEGAEVFSGDRILGRIENGELTVQAKVGVPLVVTQRQAGWYPATTLLASPADGTTYPLPQLFRVGTWEAQVAYLTNVPFGLKLGGAWHWIPDQLTVEFDAGAWALTSEFPPVDGTKSMPFYRSDLLLLYRFFPVDWPFRMAVGTGGTAMAFVPGPFLYQVGPAVVLRAEYNAQRWRAFADARVLVPVFSPTNFYDGTMLLGSYFEGGWAWKF